MGNNGDYPRLQGVIKRFGFSDACQKYAEYDREFNKFFRSGTLTYWICRLYDNEKDARKAFG